jgi:double-stranded uracil-DNA glycosylase
LTRKSSFPPVVAPDTRLLILGSLPGERSLAAGRYYAHPQNRFWHLVGYAIGVDLATMPYDARLAALLAHGIGLWDVVGSATRTGSLDTAMRQVAANPLAALAATLPQLAAIAFNGAAAARIGTPLLAGTGLQLLPLPSSSPAYAAMPLAEKERRWQVIGMIAGGPLRVPPQHSNG